METQRISLDSAVDFNKLISVTVPRNGDLLSQLFLEISLPEITATGPTPLPANGCSVPTANNLVSWVNGVGFAMIDYVSIWIGQQEIDRQYGEYMYLWTQLTTPGSKRQGINTMTGIREKYEDPISGPLRLYIPLYFWFCKNPGLALPLIALQSSPIKIYIKLNNGYDMTFSSALNQEVLNGNTCPAVVSSPPVITDMVLWGDFIYLDTEERRRFTSSKHEYLIEQVQQQKRYSIPVNSKSTTVPLTLNHPIKELIWVFNQDRMLAGHEYFNYGSRMLTECGVPNTDLITTALFQFDGFDRFQEQRAEYFRLVQPWQRHTAIPNDFIYVYSFSLAPEAAQPQGSCNGSRLNSIVLQAQMNPCITSRASGVTVYAVNYNVLRIVAGLGGVLFTV